MCQALRALLRQRKVSGGAQGVHSLVGKTTRVQGGGHIGAIRDEHRSGVITAVEVSKKFLVCPENEFE